MRRRILFAGLALAIAAALWWVLRSAPAGAGPGSEPAARGPGAVAQPQAELPSGGLAPGGRTELAPGSESFPAELVAELGIPSFRGRLLLPGGGPAAAEIRAYGLNNWSLFLDLDDPATDLVAAWTVKTRADGSFLLPEAPRDGLRFVLRASAEGLPPLELLNLPSLPGRTRDLGDLRFENGFALSGRVLGPGGESVAGAEVVPIAEPEGFQGLRRRHANLPALPDYRAVTSTSGDFELRSLPAGRLRVRAAADGYAPGESAAVTGQPGGEARGVTIVLERAMLLEGTVFNQTRQPLAGARLRLEADDSRALETHSDAAGKFRLDPPEDQSLLLLRAVAPGFRPWRRSLSAEERRLPLEITLAPLPPIQGLAVNDAGAPVGGAEVHLLELRHSRDLSADPTRLPFVSRTRSGSDGTFRLEPDLSRTWQRRFRVVAWSEQHMPAWSEVLSFQEPAPEAPLTTIQLVLADGAALSGTVLDPWNAPRADARVFLRRLANRRSVSRRPPSAPNTRRPGTIYRTTTSDTAGRFQLSGVPPGEYRLEAHYPGYSPGRSEDLSLTRANPDLVLMLRASAGLTGEVLGDLEWFQTLRVSAVAPGQDAVDATVDINGEFEFRDLPSGTYSLVLREIDAGFEGRVFLLGSGEGLARADGIEVKAGETSHVTLAIDLSERSALEGVVMVNGEPAAEMSLFLVPMDLSGSQDPRLGWRTLARRLRSAATDYEGRYRFGAVDPDDYWLVLERGEVWPEGVFRLPGDGSAWQGPAGLARSELRLQPGRAEQRDFDLRVGAIRGRAWRVNQEGEESPLRGGRATLHAGPGLEGTAPRNFSVGRDGVFEGGFLPTGTWLLEVESADWHTGGIQVSVSEGGVTSLDARLSRSREGSDGSQR